MFEFIVPVKCEHCVYTFNNSRALDDHMLSDHGQSKSDSPAKLVVKEPEKKEVNLKYVLNEVKNLKVAKTNATKKLELKRDVINDVNIKYETNSALYLVLKEEHSKLKPGDIIKDVENKYEAQVEHISEQKDMVCNNPVTVIKWKVTVKEANFESKVTMNQYHSSQGINIQGGRRHGDFTSCSILASLFEEFGQRIMISHAIRIRNIMAALKSIDLRKKSANQLKPIIKNKNKSSKTEKETNRDVFLCDMCDYNSVVKGMMRRHKLLTHHMSVKPTAALSQQQTSTDSLEQKIPIECLVCYQFSCGEEWELEIHNNKAHKGQGLQQLKGTGQQGVSQALTLPQLQGALEQVKVPEQQVQLQHPALGQPVQHQRVSQAPQQVKVSEQQVQLQGGGPGRQVQQQVSSTGQQEEQQQPTAVKLVQEPSPGQQVQQQQPPASGQQGQVVITGERAGEQPPAPGQQEQTTSSGQALASGQLRIIELENVLQRLELEMTQSECKISKLTTDLDNEKEEKFKVVKKLVQEKKELEDEYIKSIEVIRTQQRDIEEKTEKIKVMESLNRADEERKIQEEEEKRENDWGEVREVRVEEVWNEEGGQLVQRLEIEERQKYFSCKKCDKILESENSLKTHLKEHNRLEQQIIMCDYCDFSTNDINIYMTHVPEVHKSRNTCKTCQAEFNSLREMVDHASVAHELVYKQARQLPVNFVDRPLFPCGFCTAAFETQLEFNKHTQEQHTRNKETILECYDCGQKSNNKLQLMEHKRSEHYKKKLCSFFHSYGYGCRFPATKCVNIHEDNIKPTLESDTRGRIPCKNGNRCDFNKTNSCHYKHDQNNHRAPTAAQSVNNVSSPPSQSPSTREEVTRTWSYQDMALMKDILLKLNHNMGNVMNRIESLEKKDFPTQGTVQNSQ